MCAGWCGTVCVVDEVQVCVQVGVALCVVNKVHVCVQVGVALHVCG